MRNYSKQREELLNILKACKKHPTAEEVYYMLKENGSSTSKSTVYRNLCLLHDDGIISKVSIIDGPDRYDYIEDYHNHVICKKCHQVFDIYYKFEDRNLIDLIEKEIGVKTNLNNMTFQGICHNCEKK